MQPPPGDSPNSQAWADAEQRSEWLRRNKIELTWLLAVLIFLIALCGGFFVHSMYQLLRLDMRWDVLLPFLVGRGVVSLVPLYLTWMVYLRLGRTESLRAAVLFGDSVMLSSAIAAHGNYRRNLVLSSSQTTEEIVDGKSRRSVFDRLLSRFQKPQL